MQQRYALLSALLFVQVVTHAQVGVLTADEMLPPGSVVTQRELGNFSAIDTLTGPSVTWDLTDVVPFGPSFTNDVLLPSTAPQAGTFPTANYVIYESVIPRYNYYRLEPASFSRIGGYATQLSVYSDPQIELVFPLQYGSTNNDTWDNTLSSFGGTYRYACIGRGTLNLPSATYADVLLVRIVLNEIFDIIVYSWYDATNGAMLVLYYPGDGVFVPEGAAFTTNLQVGINEVGESIDVRVHQAANGSLPITYSAPSGLHYRVVDGSGRQVQAGRLPASSSAVTSFLDLNNCRAGMYLLDITDERSQRAIRFVLE